VVFSSLLNTDAEPAAGQDNHGWMETACPAVVLHTSGRFSGSVKPSSHFFIRRARMNAAASHAMPTLSLLEGFLGFLIATVALWAFRLSASPRVQS
jgi:hypothetical protein